MAAPVYSRRLLDHPYTAGTVSATVPAGKVWVVTNITAVPRGSEVTGWTTYVATATGLIFALFSLLSADPRGQTWAGRVPLIAGEGLAVFQAVGSWDVIVSGYDLTAP